MITPQAPTTGKMTLLKQPTGKSIEIEYVENMLMFHEEKATGDIEGEKFSLHSGMDGSIWVQFKNLKGSMPKFRIDAKKLVESAYELAKENNLFK